jgi:hypothetical protein
VSEADFNVTYYKSVPLIPGATINQTFQQSSGVPFSLIVNDETADNEQSVDLFAEDFACKLWLLAVTLLPIMVSGEELIERGGLEKVRKPKSGQGKPAECWSPSFLGRLAHLGFGAVEIMICKTADRSRPSDSANPP